MTPEPGSVDGSPPLDGAPQRPRDGALPSHTPTAARDGARPRIRAKDRLRELLDAVLDEEHHRLGEMADGAHSSPYHFSRQLTRGTGEPPVAMRRRVMLERAAWRLRAGAGVTEVAFEAGYESVEGFGRAFARAYGIPPSTRRPGAVGSAAAGSGVDRSSRAADWLPAPNGIHFHPPMSLWVSAREKERPAMELTAHLVEHDVDDTRDLIELAKGLDDGAYRADRTHGLAMTAWEGSDESIAKILDHLVWTKEVWLAAIDGTEMPEHGADDPVTLAARADAAGDRWLRTVRDIERRGAWDDRLIDALCEPPESFVLGSVIAHVITYAAHRRLLVRHFLRDAGLDPGWGDPIVWLRERAGSDDPAGAGA